jgi:hypothetical protein
MSAQGSSRIFLYVCWSLATLALVYALIVIYAYPHDHEAHLAAVMVEKIDAQKLTNADADGQHLPPVPDPAEAKATIAGIDANDNGIRDDVELTIFREYPSFSATSTAVRSAELQYAMDLQMQLTEVSDINTWKAEIVQWGRGFSCLYDASSTGYAALESEVENSELNTKDRANRYNSIEQYRVAYKLSSDPDCDVSREQGHA